MAAISPALKMEYLRNQVLFETSDIVGGEPAKFYTFAIELKKKSPAWKTTDDRIFGITELVKELAYSISPSLRKQCEGDDFKQWIGETIRLSGVPMQVGKEFGREELKAWVKSAVTYLGADEKIGSVFKRVIGRSIKEQVLYVQFMREDDQGFLLLGDKEDEQRGDLISDCMVKHHVPVLYTQDEDDCVVVDQPTKRMSEDIEILERWAEKPLLIFEEGR